MRTHRKSSTHSSESLAGFIFVSPMLLGLCLFTFIPILIMFTLAFTDWSIISGLNIKSITWVGLDNFVTLFQDSNFLQALRNNPWNLAGAGHHHQQRRSNKKFLQGDLFPSIHLKHRSGRNGVAGDVSSI